MSRALARLALLAGGWALSAGGVSATAARAGDKAKDAVRARKVMADYARCVVKRAHPRAAEAILSNASNPTITYKFSNLINGDCLGVVAGSVELRLKGDQLRYALADALVSADYADHGENDFSNRLPLAHLSPPSKSEIDTALAAAKNARNRAELEESFAKISGVSWLSRYGECVVRREPVKARLWLLTKPDGPEEISRINDMRPAFAECISDGTMKFSRTTMRGVVAINYYRLAMSTVQPVAAKPS